MNRRKVHRFTLQLSQTKKRCKRARACVLLFVCVTAACQSTWHNECPHLQKCAHTLTHARTQTRAEPVCFLCVRIKRSMQGTTCRCAAVAASLSNISFTATQLARQSQRNVCTDQHLNVSIWQLYFHLLPPDSPFLTLKFPPINFENRRLCIVTSLCVDPVQQFKH